MKRKVLNEVIRKDKATGGNNGISFIDLVEKIGGPEEEIRESVKDLIKEKKVKVRESVNRNLIFLK